MSRRYFKTKHKNLKKLNDSEENPGDIQLSIALYPLQNVSSKVVTESEVFVTVSLKVSAKQLCQRGSSSVSSSSINVFKCCFKILSKERETKSFLIISVYCG
jgi:hypothetical protein